MKKLDKNAKPSTAKSKDGSADKAKVKPSAAHKAPAHKAPAPAEKKETSRRSITAKASKTPASSAKGAIVQAARVPAPAPKARPKAIDEEISTTIDPNLEEFSISIIKPGEKKERLWRTKSFQQLPVQREFGFPDVAPELPGGYGQDKLVLMPKDPEYMFCYWELTPNLIDHKSQEKATDGNYRETLKINWESKSLFEQNFTFIPVFFWARKWYFGVPQVGQRYQVELGWLSDTGHFISIISSNLSELPESWAQTQKRLADQGDILAYSSKHTKTIGASEHLVVEDTRAFAPEWNLSSESFSSSSWSRGPEAQGAGEPGALEAAPPAAAVTQSAPGKAAPKGKAKSKPVAKARLEIQGKVLPGTRVYVAGNKVATDKDGNFKTEFRYDQDVLNLELTSASGASRTFTYDLKELILT